MTQRLTRTGWAWIMVTLAAGCGGGSTGGGAGNAPLSAPPSTQYVAVWADGVFGHGLVLRSNGTDDLSVPGSGGYKFATQLMDGATYEISVYKQPSNPAELCAVTGGSGTASGGTAINVFVNCALIVSGTYIGVDYANSGDAASYGVTTFDDSGGYTSTSDENDARVITTGIVDSGTYSVDVTGIISPDSMTEAVSTNGEAIVTTDLTAGDTAYLDFGVKRTQSGHSDAELNGSYALVSYDHSGTTASLLTINADGAGNYSGSGSRNDAGAISSGTATTGSYTVADDGALSLDPAGGTSLRGGLSDDGQLQVLSQLTTGQAPSITFGIRLGSGPYSTALASGNYVIVTMDNAADSAAWHELNFDGAGNVFGSLQKNDSGVITWLNDQHTYLTEKGTYSVAPDGTLTLSLDGARALTGALSADGEFLILADLNAGASPTVGVGLRSVVWFNPWAY
jgi:hypothetical protein